MGDAVECRSDSEYAERPVSVWWQGERLEVTQILRRWRTPSGKGFWVSTRDSQDFELFYDLIANAWRVDRL